jgi:undecaprenyl-diphosphatase
MPDWLAVILLGVIEGVTEFLPVSSTGHLLLVENLGWLPRQTDLFNILIQSAAVTAVLLLFSERIIELVVHTEDRRNRGYLVKLIVAFLITGAGGYWLKQHGLKLPREVAPVAWATLIGGVLFLLAEEWLLDRPMKEEVTWRVAVAVALAQLAAAAFPGASRSGMTILVALLFGLSRPAATEFSFLVGIPTLLAAGGYETFKALNPRVFRSTDWQMIGLGMAAAAITAFITVQWLLRFVKTHTFIVFGWYRLALGALILLLVR